jgi:beta-galactosidase
MPTITYSNGRFSKGDQPLFIVAVDYQYYRDKREHWADRLDKLKAANANTVTFYVPWRHHLCLDEHGRRSYDFTGRTKDSRDLVTFLKLIADRDLYMIAKPGPFVHSELNIGGLPDIVSPSFNPAVTVARRHDGSTYIWEYDRSQLPSPFDPTFDALAAEWLAAVRPVLQPYVSDSGPLIAIQLNDETIFCTANNPPWSFGYDEHSIRYFQTLLREQYRHIDDYNRLHKTTCRTFEEIAPPVLPSRGDSAPGPRAPADLSAYFDWAMFHWRMRRDLYRRYIEYLGIDLPYLSNYAGITPPIVENIPGQTGPGVEYAPEAYNPVYAEWWFAQNRIDTDADVYAYGLISWLGVAAYDMNVFHRYVNTARRAPGINMEENWGFATLYDKRSKDSIIPFFQTLVSLAGGATGYVIFVGVSTDYWDDSLDRITKLQCPTFPSHAPIDEHGRTRPMYDTAKMLNTFFVRQGHDLLKATLETDATYLLYAHYAAVSSWVPDEKHWHLPGCEIPRCGYQGLEPFAIAMQEAGYVFDMTELEAAALDQLMARPALAMHSAFFMVEEQQDKLARFVEAGGRLFISGQLPEQTDRFAPCTRLRDAVKAHDGRNVTYSRTNLFDTGQIVPALQAAGISPKVRYSPNMRAFVFRNGDDYFVFFFNFDREGSHEKFVDFYGRTLHLTLGSKTSGVIRVKENAIVAWLVKGLNEVEGLDHTTIIRLGDQTIRHAGDFSSEG